MKLARRSSSGVVALGVGCCVIATLVCINHLGSSGLFSDENYSWHAAAGTVWEVFSRDRATENTPPLYYLLLHFWIRIFGDGTVWGMRVLSVIGAVAAVAGVCWLGNQLAGTGAGIAAGFAAAFAPLLVQYAQEIRAYGLLMAAVVLAGAAAVQAGRSQSHPRRWLILATVMSVATVWLHYSGILVAIVVAIYVATTSSLSVRDRRLHVGVLAAALVIVAPLMVIQLTSGHQGGIAPYSRLTATNLLRVIGTPFDGRFGPQPLTYLTGAAAVAISLAVLVATVRRRPRARETLMVIAAAVTPVLALVAVNVAVWVTNETTYYSLTTRYSTVAAPFMLVAIGYAVVRGPWLTRPLIVVLVGVACVSGLVGDYSRNTRWPDQGQAFGYVERSLAPGDVVAIAGYPLEGENAEYYLWELQLHGNPPVVTNFADLSSITAPTLFVVTDVVTAPSLNAQLNSEGWTETATLQFYPDATVIVAKRESGSGS